MKSPDFTKTIDVKANPNKCGIHGGKYWSDTQIDALWKRRTMSYEKAKSVIINIYYNYPLNSWLQLSKSNLKSGDLALCQPRQQRHQSLHHSNNNLDNIYSSITLPPGTESNV